MAKSPEIIPVERIQDSIYLIRKHKVILDKDLANLYGVKPTVTLAPKVLGSEKML